VTLFGTVAGADAQKKNCAASPLFLFLGQLFKVGCFPSLSWFSYSDVNELIGPERRVAWSLSDACVARENRKNKNSAASPFPVFLRLTAFPFYLCWYFHTFCAACPVA